ncbi:MAG: hypothetical protein D8H97_24885 [Neisseria sp.]|jgi:hypothetical protein|nr:MAG: hypothetical protein D8H97_24885 [Neisseria sp.]
MVGLYLIFLKKDAETDAIRYVCMEQVFSTSLFKNTDSLKIKDAPISISKTQTGYKLNSRAVALTCGFCFCATNFDTNNRKSFFFVLFLDIFDLL